MESALRESLARLSYPISKDAAIDRVGTLRLPTQDTEIDVPVANILRGVPQSTFRDARHAEQAIFERWERFSRSLGAIERARKLQR